MILHGFASKKEESVDYGFQLTKMKELITENTRITKRMAKVLQTFSSIEHGETSALDAACKLMPYITVNPVGMNGINYVFIINSNDSSMTKKMFGGYKGIQSEQELLTFFSLAEKYYGIKPLSGIFVDAGANIGTTSIVAKKLHRKLDVVSFEPDVENAKLFKINCILNDCTCDIRRLGLGARKEKAMLELCKENNGHHRITDKYTDGKKEQIMMSTFDEELFDVADKINYLWMDVEGYEGHVLSGMQKCLEYKKFPVWMEFSPKMLQESGGLKKLHDILPLYFSSFIDRHDMEKVLDIGDLDCVAESLGFEGNATDLFLIRKGVFTR